MLRIFFLLCITTVLVSAALVPRALANNSPDTPIVLEPVFDGQVINGSDVHMVTDEFSDLDVTDIHLASDWEIWTISPSERVWFALGVTGLSMVHIHLGDGTFENSHSGRTDLVPDDQYRLRVRHRDDSGDPGTEWSIWAERLFDTGPLSAVFPMETSDISDMPAPLWAEPTFGDTILLAGGGSPPSIRLESVDDSLLLEIKGFDGVTNQITNPSELSEHVDIRVRFDAGSIGQNLVLLETDLTFTDDDGDEQTIFLPGVNIPPGQQEYYWVSANGSTYIGSSSQTEPDFTMLARGNGVPWSAEDGYKVEVVASGFQLPVNIAFIPNPGVNPGDPLYYVTELYGTIKVVTNDGTVSDYADSLLNFNPTGNFPGSGELGLAGIVVDSTTGDVFASMVYSSIPGNEAAPLHPKVDRFSSVDGGLTAATQTTILDMSSTVQGASHQISNLTIGPDGYLYIHMGDGFVTANAQDLDSFNGKILRVDLTGAPPATNPFYDAGDGITARDHVHAYGFRNPFGGAWRLSDGAHYIVGNGPSTDRFTKLVAGQNYLWDGTDGSMTNYAIYNWNPPAAPVNAAVIESGLFGGSGFPPEKMDKIFVSLSGPTYATGFGFPGKRVAEFEVDNGGNYVSGPTDLISYNGSGKASVVGLAAGPDGLYFSDLYKDLNASSPIDPGANILRIKYVGVADFTPDVTFGIAPLTVNFTNLSTVPTPTGWFWTFGDSGTSAVEHASHTYNDPGIYDVRLSVYSADGVITKQENDIILVFTPVGVPGGRHPVKYSLHSNSPNPFGASTVFRFDLPEPGEVKLVIYNVRGQRVKTLLDGGKPAGFHDITWDGRTDAGSEVASGIYLYQIQVSNGRAGVFSQTKKLVVLR